MQIRSVVSAAVPYICVAVACFAGLRYLQPVRVNGQSMRPALSAGDLVFVARNRPVEVGQIALLRTNRRGLVLHRVVEVDAEGGIRTKGDANFTPDASSTPAAMVSGPVVSVVPVGRALERWRRK